MTNEGGSDELAKSSYRFVIRHSVIRHSLAVLDWLVITADRKNAGRGVRGLALAWFLRTYFGRRRVAICTPAEYRRSPAAADTIFLGLPSTLAAEEIASLSRRCRRLVPFDYLDQQKLAWTEEQEAVLREYTDLYLKPWFEPSWNYGLRMGLLPLRRYGRFTAAVVFDRTLGRLRRRPEPEYDVAFLGRPNRTRMFQNGKFTKIDQRVAWLCELRREAPDIRFWGGLVDMSQREQRWLRLKFGDLSDLNHTESKVGFATYYRAMQRSRVLLAPGGNVPWSYRHYECLYAGGVVVTIDYRERDMLVPLPRAGMIHVPDGASVLPAVRAALALSRERPELREENIAHLERYFWFGAYSRRRPALIERFIEQLS